MKEIYERIERLEKEGRFFKITTIVGFLLLGVILLTGVSEPNHLTVMKVRGLEVVDAQGRTRAEISVDDRATRFWMNDPDEQLRLSFLAFTDRANFGLHDGPKGYVRASIHSASASSGESLSGLLLRSANMKNSAFLTTSDAEQRISFRRSELAGKEGKVIWEAPRD